MYFQFKIYIVIICLFLVTDTSENQKNSSDSTKPEHDDISTKNVLEDTPESTTTEKINTTKEHALILSIIGGAVSIVVAVVACIVMVYVIQRRRTENRPEKSDTNYEVNEYMNLKDLPTKDIHTSRSSSKGCQDRVNISINDVRPEMTVQENEIPEYASVIPKEFRN